MASNHWRGIAAAGLVFLLCLTPTAQADWVNIETVSIGNAGNAGFGAGEGAGGDGRQLAAALLHLQK